ncbi:LD-carboxypeptidase [Bacteroidales bacterium OttesenSCG-928-B11]|nr:LD-carboxypeptidase [Bacteroidales bacterium OttesenSCG-928-C03]MDL2311961.1 LD-carboxypeptidase [Bacteroidales bacterium OttesenSCG-928-B11]
MITTPPYLKPGDLIGITATAHRIEEEDLYLAIKIIESRGYKILFSPNLFEKENQYAGNDRKRTEDFQHLLDHPNVKAILCARGGYGSVRIIDQIDLSSLSKNPKWICGYSDVTVFHTHLHQNQQFATIHSTMPISVKQDTAANLYSLLQALEGETLQYTTDAHPLNRNGKAQGELIGGNLSILYSVLGSKSDINTDGKILFIEDLDEYLYHIDRMMMNLKRNGKLRNLAGLIVGGMSDMHDNKVPYGKTAEEIVAEHVAEFDYPVCYNFPAGHTPDNRALRFGQTAMLTIDGQTELIIPA